MLIRKLLISLLFTIAGVGLTGCFSDDGVDQKYFKTFEHIKTDQFVWSYGRGGIYWVTDNAVVLDAVVNNSEGVPERGIYQVNMDGSYIRLVEKKYKGSFDYCFNGDTLFVRGNGPFTIFNQPSSYKLAVGKKIAFRKGYSYSEIRCQKVKRPTNNGYYFLRENDGAIKVSRSRSNKLGMSDKSHSDTHVILSNNAGDELKLLDITVDQLSMPRYFPDREVYFGSSFFDNCGKLWWLYVDGWKVRTQKKCLGRWAATNSVIALPTRAGLFIEHHTGSQKFKTHLVTDNKEYALETVSARRAVLAPGGCRVAYGSGEMGFGKNRLSQVLKVFDSCQFMEDQGE